MGFDLSAIQSCISLKIPQLFLEVRASHGPGPSVTDLSSKYGLLGPISTIWKKKIKIFEKLIFLKK